MNYFSNNVRGVGSPKFKACRGKGGKYDPIMILETIPEVKRLTPAEKLLLVGELWDDLATHPTEIPVSREQIAELDRRMAEYRRDPSQVTSWEAIQTRVLGRTLSGE